MEQWNRRACSHGPAVSFAEALLEHLQLLEIGQALLGCPVVDSGTEAVARRAVGVTGWWVRQRACTHQSDRGSSSGAGGETQTTLVRGVPRVPALGRLSRRTTGLRHSAARVPAIITGSDARAAGSGARQGPAPTGGDGNDISARAAAAIVVVDIVEETSP